MSDITITLPEERRAKLRERAAAYGISAEELVRASIDNLIGGPDEEFEKAADFVLKRNEELYQRLA
jgi:plasmid stability protein